MKALPLGLIAASVLVLAGCTATRTVAPAPEGKSSALGPRGQVGMSSAETMNSPVRPVEISTKYVHIPGALPEATGALAFLADDAGLRAGTVSLTQKQADAAQRELCRIIGTELRSTSPMTVESGRPAKLRFNASAEMGNPSPVKISVGGNEQEFRVRYVGVSLEVTPQMLAAGMIQLGTQVEVTDFEGFVEYGGVEVTLPSSSDQASDAEKQVVKVPPGFFQPIFSTHSMTFDVPLAAGRVLVLKAEHKIGATPEAVARMETLLVFLTAKMAPLVR